MQFVKWTLEIFEQFQVKTNEYHFHAIRLTKLKTLPFTVISALDIKYDKEWTKLDQRSLLRAVKQ